MIVLDLKKIASNSKIDKLIEKMLANNLAFYGFQEKPKVSMTIIGKVRSNFF